MKNSNSKIKKEAFILKLVKRTLPNNQLLRYSIACFLAGFFFMTISTKTTITGIDNTIETIGCFAIVIGYYLFPFIQAQNKERYFYKFSIYILLLTITIFLTLFWIGCCFINICNTYWLFIFILISIVDITFIIISVSSTLKPLMHIIQNISNKIKSKASENKENATITYIKSSCASISIIISCIISLISFITTMGGYIKPLVEKITGI